MLSSACLARDSALSVDELKKYSIDDLMDIEVTSVSRSPEKLSDAASSVQVITQEDIRRSGASSLPEALRLASNLQVAQKSSHAWAISARGFNTDLANKLLVMIDGRTVYTPLFSGVFWDTLDYLLADIERIEVISGPGGTLWGANAVNGVISITTKHAKDTQGMYTEVGGGTRLQDFAGLRYGGVLGSNIDFRVYAKHFNRGDEALANGDDADDAWRMTQGGFRVDAAPTALDRLVLQGDAYSGREDMPTGDETRVRGANLRGRWSRALAHDGETSLQFYYDHTHLDDPVPGFVINTLALAPAGQLIDDLDTYDVDFQHRLRLSKHHLVWGLGFRFTHDVVNNAPSLAFLPTLLDHYLYSGFIQDEIELLKSLKFTFGTKLEHNDYTGFEFEPNMRLQWSVNSQNMVWTAISRAVRTPSRVDRDLSQPAPGYLVVLKGSDDFVSETVVAYELGYRAQVNARLMASIATFYNSYDHVRSTSITAGTIIPFYFANNVKGETYGAELVATYQVRDGWQLRASYAPLFEHLRVAPGQFDLSHANNETADPPQRAAIRSALNFAQRFEWDAGLRWVDILHINNGPNLATVPSYVDLDTRLGWRISNNIELSLVGQNLLHAHHPEYGFPGPARIEAARSIAAKLVWRL